MDPNKHPTNKKGNKTNEKPMNSNKSKTQEDAGQPHGPSYSFGYKLEYTGLLGHQFNFWKKGLLEEAHESKLKSGVKAKVNFAYKMIDHMVSLLKVQLTEEKDFNELMEKVEKMEKSPKDFGFHLKSIESFIESNDLLQEAYGGVYDIVEQQKWERLFNSN